MRHINVSVQSLVVCKTIEEEQSLQNGESCHAAAYWEKNEGKFLTYR